MTWITHIAISNSVVAAILGLIAYVVGRRAKSASIGHALWILVLVKLVTPPVYRVPLPVLPPIQDSSATVTTVSPDALSPTAMDQFTPENSLSAATQFARAIPGLSLSRLDVQVWLWRVWIAGAILYGFYQLYVTLQMCRLMKMAVPDCRIDRSMHRIARNANVRNYPTARVVPWVGSPMLWGLGSTSVIVLPEQLFDSLEEKAADTLLQHELAHFQRGDQWVRILEVLASTLFWWHPVVWLAMREIEVYEEQCCDAWVVQQDYTNRRRYAEALLDTVDFISDAPDSMRPLVASGLGRVPLLERRITLIMKGDRQSISMPARIAIAFLSMLIPLQPSLLHARFTDARPSTSTVAALQPSEEGPFPEFLNGIKQHREESLQAKVRARAAIPEIEYAIADSVYGTYQLVATSGYRVRLKEVVTGRIIDLADYQIRCATFAPPRDQAPTFAAGCLDGSVYIFDCLSGEQTRQLTQISGIVHSLAYSPDGGQLAVGGDDRIIHLFDLNDGTSQSFDHTFGPVQSIRFSEAGDKLAVVTNTTLRSGSPGRVDIWDAKSGVHQQTIHCPTPVGVAGFDTQGNVLTAEWNGMLRTWSRRGRLRLARQKPKEAISAAAFSSNAITLETLSEMESFGSSN